MKIEKVWGVYWSATGNTQKAVESLTEVSGRMSWLSPGAGAFYPAGGPRGGTGVLSRRAGGGGESGVRGKASQ